MYSCFGDDVGIETIAEIDGVDVVTVGTRRISNRPKNRPDQ